MEKSEYLPTVPISENLPTEQMPENIHTEQMSVNLSASENWTSMETLEYLPTVPTSENLPTEQMSENFPTKEMSDNLPAELDLESLSAESRVENLPKKAKLKKKSNVINYVTQIDNVLTEVPNIKETNILEEKVHTSLISDVSKERISDDFKMKGLATKALSTEFSNIQNQPGLQLLRHSSTEMPTKMPTKMPTRIFLAKDVPTESKSDHICVVGNCDTKSGREKSTLFLVKNSHTIQRYSWIEAIRKTRKPNEVRIF